MLGDGQRAVGVPWQQHALGEVRGRPQVDGAGLMLEHHSWRTIVSDSRPP